MNSQGHRLYFARLHTCMAAPPPADGLGLVKVSVSPANAIRRSWLAPSKFG
jgi:hypothetical protein